MQRLERLYIEVPAFREGQPGAYLFGAALAVLAAAIRYGIDPYVTGIQYITFFPAVIVTTLVSGFAAGLFCTALCAGLASFLFLTPSFSFWIVEADQVVGLVLFVLLAAFYVLVISALRYAIRRYRELSGTLEQRVAERSGELLKTQQMLSRAQKMEALGQLTGGLAHDFNNMMAVVVGNLDLMRRRLAKGETDVTRFLDNATEGATRATQLSQRLLAFARHQPLAPGVVDVNKLVVTTSELLRRTIGEQVGLECVQAGGLWRAHIDASQLENAIVNLAVNARDAMPGGGALTIETANAYLDERYAAQHEDVTPGQYVVVAVTDSGIGMSAETLARAVEPFFTTKETGKGTGLGLSQVYGFVKQSGGHLSIYSEEGRGTTVRLYLPRSYAGEAAQPAPGDRDFEGGLPTASARETILVVEDEDHVRRMSVATLRELGYEVIEAANAREALELLADAPRIGLLFTDVVMPGMNGRKLADAAREHRADLPVLYTTGYTRNAIVHDGTLDPGVELIVKPFTVDQLARKVRAILDRHAAASTASAATDAAE